MPSHHAKSPLIKKATRPPGRIGAALSHCSLIIWRVVAYFEYSTKRNSSNGPLTVNPFNAKARVSVETIMPYEYAPPPPRARSPRRPGEILSGREAPAMNCRGSITRFGSGCLRSAGWSDHFVPRLSSMISRLSRLGSRLSRVALPVCAHGLQMLICCNARGDFARSSPGPREAFFRSREPSRRSREALLRAGRAKPRVERATRCPGEIPLSACRGTLG